MPSALITGVTGQDGSYLAEFLLARGYQVIGTTRNAEATRLGLLSPILNNLEIVEADLVDASRLQRLLQETRPDEVYNLAGLTQVGLSWADPVGSGEVNALGAVRLFEAVRLEAPTARVFQASSCEIFEASPDPRNEGSPLGAVTPYGIAKLHAHLMARAYRERYGLFVSAGILFNHESPRRGEDFVTRKITRAAARIARGGTAKLKLGNLEARRDWGFAGDFVEAMWKLLQRGVAEDMVIATGTSRSVRDFCEAAFRAAGLDYRDHVESDPSLIRRGDAPVRVGDPARARARLGWTPRVSFADLVGMMVESDLTRETAE